MGLLQATDELDYPEADGQPMGETDIHIDWMIRLRDILKHRYAGQQVYIATNLLLYYAEGLPYKYLVPDVFAAKGTDPGPRRIFKTWEEKRWPNVVFEITSRGTRREDEITKPQIYAQLGVREYFLYAPTAEYLKPPLQGFRLTDGAYRKIEPDAAGNIVCEELEFRLHLAGRDLVLTDNATGTILPTAAEATAAERDAEKAKTAELESEVAQLKAMLRKRDEA